MHQHVVLRTYHDGVYVIAIFCGFFLRETHAGIFSQGKEQVGDTKAGSLTWLLKSGYLHINNRVGGDPDGPPPMIH